MYQWHISCQEEARKRNMAADDTMRRLWRYKSDLEQEPDEEKLLEILGKLKRLSVSIAALQETGIGRKVNSYRKREGVVGELARRVVSSWKAVVEKEVKTSTKNRSPSQSPKNSGSPYIKEEKYEENSGGEESEADSWNSFKEETSSQDSKISSNQRESSLRRKRKHSADSDNSEENGSKSSRVSKKTKHPPFKLGHVKVEPAEKYSSIKKKKSIEDSGDFIKSEHRSRTDGSTKVSAHTISPKNHGDKNHSSSSHSHKGHQSKSSGHKGSGERTKASSHHDSASEKGDRQIERQKVDRRQKRHSISSSGEEDGHASVENQSSSISAKPSPSSSSHKLPSSSSSHKHSSSSNSQKHSSSSSSHKHSSSDSHKHSTSSSSQKLSSSLGSHKNSSISSSHKHSSSNSHKHSSSSHKHFPSSDSHKHSPSSDSPKHSSSSSHKHPSSNSHKHSSSSNSHKHSSSSGSRTHSSSPSSHKDSDSSRAEKHSPPSTSHKRSSSKSSNHGISSSDLLQQIQPSSLQQSRTPETVSSKSVSSSRQTSSSGHRHVTGSSTSQKQSGSSTSQRQPGSSTSHDLSGERHTNSDHASQSHEKSSNKSTSSSRVDRIHQHSGHSHSKKSAGSDSKSSLSPGVEMDKNVSSSLKENSSSSKEKSLSTHSRNHSHKDEDSLHQSTSNRHSEKEKLDKKTSSSVHKQDSSNPEQSELKMPLPVIHIKIEKQHPDTEGHKMTSCTSSSKKAVEAKSSTSKFTEIKSRSSGHRRSKHKDTFEHPDFDLFSEAIHIKTEPSSPVHRSKSLKQTPSKSNEASLSTSPPSLLSPHHVVSDSKVKLESSSISSPKNNSVKAVIKQESDEYSDSAHEQKKSKPEKDKHVKRKKVESPLPEENNMSFEDFMTFDEAALVKKGKSSLKSSTKGSSSSSSKNSRSKADKLPGIKWSSSLVDLPSSSKMSFSVPAPSSSVTVTEIDILSMLPETQADYKPLRYNPYYRDDKREPSPPPLVDPDIIGTKSVSRTHVYSGRKHGVTELRPLYDLCMQVLIDNIDAIDYVGGTPYSILKPVLERCSAQQLYQLEDYNPHFLEDSDELWENLCQRDFRGSKPEEMETWRELYMRRFEERELKYQKLKQCMSTSIAKGQAGRKAQLAYVDTVAKPPREVLRRQKQFGTGSIIRTKNNPNIKGSSSGLRAYKPSTLVPAHNPMNDRPRMVKPMPPMMAKSLQMRKNMRR